MHRLIRALKKQAHDELAHEVAQVDKGIHRYCTTPRYHTYVGEEATKKAKLRRLVTKRNAASLQASLDHLERVRRAPRFTGDLTITVEWKRSHMWGSNPRASTNHGHHGDSIGGCGYDKQSTAVAAALNSHLSLLRTLYEKKNRLLKAWTRDPTHEFNNECFGYGSGYGLLPAFDGGVGVDCYAKILHGLGLDWEHSVDTKTLDVFVVHKHRGKPVPPPVSAFDAMLKRVSMVAALGDVFAKTPEERNAWKKRILLAGLGNQGLRAPDDFDALPEPEKKKRLDAVIAAGLHADHEPGPGP